MAGDFGVFGGQVPASGAELTQGCERLGECEQLKLLQHVITLSQDAFVIADAQTGAFLDCNTRAYERLGYSREEYIALGPGGLQVDADHNEAWLSSMVKLINEQPVGSFKTRHRSKSGDAIDVDVHYSVVNHQGRRLVLAMHRDQTELHQTQLETERLNRLLLEAERLAGVGSWELIHATGDLVWSEGTYRLFEATDEDFIPSYEAFLAAVHPEDRELVDRSYTQSLQSRQPYRVTHRLLLPSGRLKVVQERGETVYDDQGLPVRSIGTVQDVTLLAEYEQKLLRAAYVDPLTELSNRQAAILVLEQQLKPAESSRQGHRVALPISQMTWSEGERERGIGALNIDVDQFQAFNDTFGRGEGDRLLQAVASLLRHHLPPSAFLARLDSDEFLVLWSGDLSDLRRQAQRIQKLLQEEVGSRQRFQLQPTVSIGIAHCPSHVQDPLSLIQASNTALVDAKKTGKSAIGVYSRATSQKIRQRLEMEAELDLALHRQSFRLAFQPQVDLDGVLVGAEVLLRWNDQHGTPVPPSVFIPLSEQTGQIHAISAWVMEESCRQLRQWRDQGLRVPRLAINLSAMLLNMGDSGCLHSLVETVRRHGLKAENFELEITETALINDPESSQREALDLAKAGFKLAIDDFGTGYASLTSLHTFPVSKIKIDTSFVRRLPYSVADEAIVKSTIKMAHDLGLVALAEGVETEQQLRILRSLNCDLCQGYLFGLPMTADAFCARLKEAQG